MGKQIKALFAENPSLLKIFLFLLLFFVVVVVVFDLTEGCSAEFCCENQQSTVVLLRLDWNKSERKFCMLHLLAGILSIQVLPSKFSQPHFSSSSTIDCVCQSSTIDCVCQSSSIDCMCQSSNTDSVCQSSNIDCVCQLSSPTEQCSRPLHL